MDKKKPPISQETNEGQPDAPVTETELQIESACPQLTFSEDSGPGSHSPLSLQVLAKQTLIMDSEGTESDFSDIDVNYFAQRVLRSPRMHHKSKEDNEEDVDRDSHVKDQHGESKDGQVKRKWEENGEESRSPPSPTKKQKDMNFPDSGEVKANGVKKLDLSASSVDSALGSSVINTPGSGLSESSSIDTDTDDSNSPVASTGGTQGVYRKLDTSVQPLPPLHFSDEHVSEQFKKLASDADSVRSLSLSNGNEGFVENLILHRLADENLGMRLSVEGGKNGGHIKSVIVKSVVEDGAAYRASGSSVGICPGDEILEVNGTNLRRLNHDDCIAVFREIPQRVHLVVKRAEPPPHRRMSGHGQIISDVQNVPGTAMPELGNLEGFILQDVTIRKTEGENLGISIVPSYGTTRDFYQIKRLLPSGACAQSGKLQVGDRLLHCNGQLLKGLTQAQCLSALKKGGDDLTFRILRQADGDASLEISSSLSRHDKNTSTFESTEVSDTKGNQIYNNSGTENLHTDRVDESHETQPSISEVFAQQNVKLAFTQPFPPQQFSDDSESVTDSNMSSPVKESKDLLEMDDNQQLIDVGGFEIETSSSGQLDNTYLVDTPVVDLETTPRDWETENDTEFDGSAGSRLPPIIEGIPPPMEFADTPPDILSAAPDQTVPVTNIDDLLGLDEDDVPSNSLYQEVSESSTVQYYNKSCDLLLDIDGAADVSEMAAPSAEQEQTSDLLGELSSQSAAVIDPAPSNELHASEEEVGFSSRQSDKLDKGQDENVTAVEVTSIDDFISIGNVTQIPVQTDNTVGEDSSLDNTVHVTTKSVNQHIVSTVDVTNKSENTKPASDTPVSASFNVDDGQKINSAVIEVNGKTSNRSTVIKIDTDQKVKNMSPLHFVPPVQSSVKDANGEEIIQPMKMRKEKGGVRVFEEGAAESVKAGKRQLDPDAKRDLADVLLQLTKSSEQLTKKPNENVSSVDEEDIVPTKISREEAKKVLSVFEKWLSPGEKTTVSPFKKMVSNIIDAKPAAKVTKIRVGSTTPLHVIPPVFSEGSQQSDQEEVITPVLMRKDNKGVRSFETGSSNSSPVYKPRKLDEEAKRDLANILSGLTKSYEETYEKKKPEGSASVEEQEIVATKISKEEAKTLMNVFANWMKSDEKPKTKPSAFRKLVSNVIDDLDEPDKEEILTVTKDKTEVVIEQKSHASESAPPSVVDSYIMVSSQASSSFAPPKPTSKPQEPVTDTNSNIQQSSPKAAPVPAPKPSPSEPQRDTQESVVLRASRPSATPNSPKLGIKSLNRFSTGSLPPLNVSRAPPKMAGLSLNKSHGLQFSGGKTSKPEYQKMRREDGPFQVDVLKGIVGLGLKLQATPDGFTKVSEIQRNSAVDKNGQIKVGDFVLSINTTTMSGQSDGRIQQVLRLLPRGLAKIVVSAVPPSDVDLPPGTTDSLASSAEKTAGPTSPFGVRLGAKPFNTEESRSATVTSPLTRDSGFFERRKPSFTQETKKADFVDNVQKPVQHVSTIDVSKKESEVKQEESKTNEKHVSKINVVKSTEELTEVDVDPKKTDKLQAPKDAEIKREITSTIKSSSEVSAEVPTVKDVTLTTETVTVAGAPKRDHEDVSKDVKVDVKAEDDTQSLKGHQEPVRPPRPAPRQQVQNTENQTVKPHDVKEKETETERKHSESGEAKSPPRVPPKPKARGSRNDPVPPSQPEFVSNIAVQNQPETKETSVPDLQNKFVSNISVEKETSPPKISSKQHKHISNDEVDEGVVVDVKPKPQDKTPPPVPPKPRRKSSESSDVSSSSALSDDLHYENEIESGQRRRRKSSNSSEMSIGSLKSEVIPEETYSQRKKNENAPEKRSVKEKMAAFEAFQRNDDSGSSSSTSSSRSGSFVTSARKISSSSQGQEVHVARLADLPKPKTRTDFVSSAKQNVPDEDGVFIVSRISIKSQISPDSNKENTSAPTSPTSPASPLSPDGKHKLNAALAPKKRTGLSDAKPKPEPGHHHAVPKTSSSIFKPTGLERLKNLTGHKTDSGEVAHSSSPEGVYKIGTAKINSALSPRRPSTEEPTSPVRHKFGSAPHKLHSGEGRKIMSTSKISGKTTSFSTKDTVRNEDASPALVTAKVVHITKHSTSDNVKDNVAPSVEAPHSHSVVTSSYVTDHKHVDMSLDMPKTAQDTSQSGNSVAVDSSTFEDREPSRVSQISTSKAAPVEDETDHTVVAKAFAVEVNEEPENERETENVKIQVEEVTEQIRVHSSELDYEEVTEPELSVQEESVSHDQHVEKIVAGKSGFAEKIVEASLEAAKQQLVSEVINKDNESVETSTEHKEKKSEVTEIETPMKKFEETEDHLEKEPVDNVESKTTDSDYKEIEQGDENETEKVVSESDIAITVTDEVVSSTQVPVPATPNTEDDTIVEQELEKNASELVALTLKTATRRLEDDKNTGSVAPPPDSPPPLPGSAPPPLPAGPPPPVPSGEANDDDRFESESEVVIKEKTSSVEENTVIEVTEATNKTSESDEVPKATIKTREPDEVPEVTNEIREPGENPEATDETSESDAGPPPLPSGPPPVSQKPTVSKQPPPPRTMTTSENRNEEDGTWVEEIEKVAAQESKFDLLINFDSKAKLEIDQVPPQAETPTSDTDSGVSIQINSPTIDSAIVDGTDQESLTKSDNKVEECQVSDVQESLPIVGKFVSTSVEPVVESTVSGEKLKGRKDTGTDSGVESPGEVSNKTVTVQYSSHVSSHEQDSFSSVDSLHDIAPSVLSTQTTLHTNIETNTQEIEKVAPKLHARKSSDVLSDSNNVSVSQVSSFRESSPSDVLKDSESSKQDLSSSSDRIFSSTPTKESDSSTESAFKANVSVIQSNSTKVNNSQDLSTSSSSVLNKSFSVSPKSKSMLSKRKWKMVSSVSDGTSDLSISDLTEVTDNSLVSKEELSSMISMANQTMDKTGISLEDEIVVVVLTRDNPEQELGFDLRDGILKSKVVCNIKPGSLAEKEQRLQLKDCLVSVNGKTMEDLSAEEVMKLLGEPSQNVTLVVTRRGSPASISNGHSASDSSLNGNGVDAPAPTKQGPGVFEVVMKKGVTGVGFCLEGGKGSPKGDMPILIKRIFKGGPAEKCGQLQVRDEILKVNDTDFTTLRHYEAWNHLKFLPDGDVRILIQRK